MDNKKKTYKTVYPKGLPKSQQDTVDSTMKTTRTTVKSISVEEGDIVYGYKVLSRNSHMEVVLLKGDLLFRQSVPWLLGQRFKL